MNNSALQDLSEALDLGVDDAMAELSHDIRNFAKSLENWSATQLRMKLREWSDELIRAAACTRVLTSARANAVLPGSATLEADICEIGCEMRAFAEELGGPRLSRREASSKLRNWSKRTAALSARATSLHNNVELAYRHGTPWPPLPFENASPFVHAVQSRAVWKAICKLRSARAAGDLQACENERSILEHYARQCASTALRKACRRAWFEDNAANGTLDSQSCWGDGDIECLDGIIWGVLK